MSKIKMIPFLSLVLLASTAVVIRHDVPDQAYRDLASNYPAVGTMVSPIEDFFCACTLVAPDLVITAAHCIDVNSDGQPDSDEMTYTQIIFGGDGNNPTHSVPVDTFYLNPKWHQSWPLNGLNGNDIALIRLQTPITDITPMAVSIANPVGFVGTTVGYGATANGNATSIGDSDGLKRAGQNLIEYKTPIGTGDLEIGALHGDFDSPDGSSNTMNLFFQELGLSNTSNETPLDLEGFGWGGDSGGPVCANFNDGSGNVVVGIASASFNPINESAPCGYGAIDIWASFINPSVPEFLESFGLTLHTGMSSPISEVNEANFKLNVFPNPSADFCHFEFDVKHPGNVSLNIFDLNGSLVETLIEDGRYPTGSHSIQWNPTEKGAGVYIYKLRIGKETKTGRLVLIE